MRVTTRKIRSLLQASRDVFGLTDDSWVLDELRQLASVLESHVTPRSWPNGTRRRSTHCLPSWSGAGTRTPRRRRSAAVSNRAAPHLTAMRSPRYFRLLDALDQLRWRRIPSSRAPRMPRVSTRIQTCTKAAKSAATAAKADRDEALHRIRKGRQRLRYVAAATGKSKVADRAKSIQTLLGEHQDSVVSRTHLSQESAAAHTAGKTPSPTDCFTSARPTSHSNAATSSTRRWPLRKSVRKAR